MARTDPDFHQTTPGPHRGHPHVGQADKLQTTREALGGKTSTSSPNEPSLRREGLVLATLAAQVVPSLLMRMTAERIIQRPAGEVAEFFFDASNNPRWQDGMVSCEWTTAPPIGVGSTYEQKARFMGRDIDSTFVVTAFESGRMIAIETIESTFPIQVVRRVEPLDGRSCRVTAEITGGPEKGLMKWLEPIMAGRAQKSVDGDYDRLVPLLETA